MNYNQRESTLIHEFLSGMNLFLYFLNVFLALYTISMFQKTSDIYHKTRDLVNHHFESDSVSGSENESHCGNEEHMSDEEIDPLSVSEDSADTDENEQEHEHIAEDTDITYFS
jgi:hypothetical protein